jgi:uncharacterized protein (DUF433 family)
MVRSAAKAAPFSIRLRAEDDRFVREESRRLQRSRGALVEAYAAEAIRTRRYPGIAFRGDDYRRRAWVVGTGLDVWELIALLKDYGSERPLAGEYGLTPGQIRIARAYYDEFTDEIDELIVRGRRSEADVLRRHPFIQTFDAAVRNGDTGGR